MVMDVREGVGLKGIPLASEEAMRAGLYWFREEELVEPIDWDYLASLPVRVRAALDAYMRGEVSLGKAAELSGLGFVEFDRIRTRARVPVRAP